MKECELLKHIPIFSCLDDDALDRLARVAVRKKFTRNTVLLSEGDITDSLYVIVSGKVKTIITDENGREIILSISGAGDYFGEMALIDGEPRSATIVTREACRLLVFSKEDLKEILRTNPDMVFSLLKGLVKRLRETDKKIESLALMDVYGRIAQLLMQMAIAKEDFYVIDEPLTHQEIANMVGASREMVSRILNELSRGGFIRVEKKIITVLKKLPYAW
ncbi:MAG: Crp/Fnr family transcriptional regulator [Desulfobacterales bacterium]